MMQKMAHERSMVLVLVAIIFALCALRTHAGTLHCETLPVHLCAFAVSSTGARCVLEKSVMKKEFRPYECQTSTVRADVKFAGWVETDDCVKACGHNRQTLGLSSDVLVEKGVAATQLCSAACQDNCPNMVELYTELAMGEGMSLSRLCELVMKKEDHCDQLMAVLVSGSSAAPPPSTSSQHYNQAHCQPRLQN